jgi:Na+/H+-dicarboxylate symporter
MPIPRARSVAVLAKATNRPSITLWAVALGLWLGTMQFPFLQYLRPVGEFYIGLLQMCVLPYLLATIPVAVRSAFTSGIAGGVMRRLVMSLVVTTAAVALIATVVPTVIFHYMPMDQATTSRIGTLFGTSSNQVDIEFAIDARLSREATTKKEPGLLAVIPSNVFSALAADDSLRVVVFALIFGAGMVISERRSGRSIFSALRHIQDVCVLIFDWFNLFALIGIVALIAPQVALIGPDVFGVLAPFASAFLVTSGLLLVLAVFALSLALRVTPRHAVAKLLGPLALAAATRNTLICTPSVLDTLEKDFKAVREPCQLYIPLGFAVIRFGTMVYFVVATLFVGHLMGRAFTAVDVVLVAGFSVMASFATLGASGLAALAPLAAVLRPFGLSYELALPLMTLVDPIANMVRTVLNVALNCQIPALAAGRTPPVAAPAAPAA